MYVGEVSQQGAIMRANLFREKMLARLRVAECDIVANKQSQEERKQAVIALRDDPQKPGEDFRSCIDLKYYEALGLTEAWIEPAAGDDNDNSAQIRMSVGGKMQVVSMDQAVDKHLAV
jgi:acyl transferase domain-containing protein